MLLLLLFFLLLSSVGADVDGAYFGTTFPHLFLMTFPQVRYLLPAACYNCKVTTESQF